LSLPPAHLAFLFHAADTASASRDHIVTVDPDGMITVTGGWLGSCGVGRFSLPGRQAAIALTLCLRSRA
jgi:hypothetical protein